MKIVQRNASDPTAVALSAAPKVSVIIPHYHDLDGLSRCLAALEGQTYPQEDFEIVVGDNNSPEGEAAVAGVIAGRARLVVIGEKGAGPARNGAVAASKGGVLAFIDSDCVAEPQWLTEGVAALTEHDFIGGRVRVLVDDAARMSPTEAFERVFAFDFKSYITRKGFTGAGNLLCSRELFDRVGGFRVAVSEDVEWSQRARSMGYRLGYAPAAVVGHPARRTWSELLAKWRRVNAETYGLSLERGSRLRWLTRCLALPISAFVHTPRVFTSRELNSLGQRFAALTILYRLRIWRCADSLRLLLSKEPA